MTSKRFPALKLIAPFCAFLLGACVPDGGTNASAVTERDSAGIRIRTHADGPFTDTISTVPLLTIGEEGHPDYEFFRIGEVGALASGTIVVANGGTHELRFFDAAGRYLRTAGRRGDGPDEFGFLSAFRLRPGDTIAVFDPRRRRIVYFDSAGTLVRGQSFAQEMVTDQPNSTGPCFDPGLVGLLHDGTRIVRGWGCMAFQGSDGVRPSTVPIDLVRTDERIRINTFVNGQVWERTSAENLGNRFSMIPLGANLSYAIGPDRIYVSEGIDYEIKAFDRNGRLVGLLREDARPPDVSAADRQTYVEARSTRPRPHPPDVPFPDRFGSYQSLKVSHEGEVWARRYPLPGDSLQRWVVFSADGREVRRVVVGGVQMETIRGGKIYGVRTDSLGIQTVVVLNEGGS